jgi:hypothetical protein
VTTWWDEQTDQRRSAVTTVLDSSHGQQYLAYAYGDRGFAAWLLVADATCIRRLGVSIFDLSDWAWRGAYDDGATPGQALRDAVHADDTFGMLLGGQE